MLVCFFDLGLGLGGHDFFVEAGKVVGEALGV